MIGELVEVFVPVPYGRAPGQMTRSSDSVKKVVDSVGAAPAECLLGQVC